MLKNSDEYESNNSDYPLLSLNFLIDRQYVFAALSISSTNLTFDVRYVGKNKKSLTEFYSDILESDLMDFKVSMAIPYCIVSKMGYLDVNEIDKKLRIIVEYTIIEDISVAGSNNLVYNIFKHMHPIYIQGLGEISASTSLYKLVPNDLEVAKNIFNTTWLFCINLNIIDPVLMNYTNPGFLNSLYNYVVHSTEEDISNILTHNGRTHIGFDKIYNSYITDGTMQIDVKFIPKRINNLEASYVSKDSIIIEDNDLQKNDIINLISSFVSDCFFTPNTIMMPKEIIKQSSIIGLNYKHFSQFNIRNVAYSIKDPHADYFYKKLIYSSEDLVLYKRHSFHRSKRFFGLMSYDIYQDAVLMDASNKQSKLNSIIGDIAGTKNHTKLIFLKMMGNCVYFTLE